MKITPTKENDSYEKILEYLDPVNNKAEAEIDPYKQKYSDIKFIGRQKRAAPIPISKPNIREYSEANLMFMNINSIQSEDKQQKAKMGILKNKPDIIILAETKTADEDPEFQIDGYFKVTGISRKARTGGMLVLAKDTLNILHADAVSVVQEVQVVNFTFNEHLIIGVYCSPTIIGPHINHHKKLITHISKLLNKLPPDAPFIITGDFNLPELAACNFRPKAKLFDYTEIFDDGKESINQMWADFFMKYDLER
jgi:exonuclease III